MKARLVAVGEKAPGWVAEGFAVEASFGSAATVVREHIGGLRGQPLQAGDELPCRPMHTRSRLFIPPELCPSYQDRVTVRVIPGYQQASFSRLQQRRFFSHAWDPSRPLSSLPGGMVPRRR